MMWSDIVSGILIALFAVLGLGRMTAKAWNRLLM
jgi:hypothetical protein